MACEFGGTTQRLCLNDSCKICFNRSFASHEKSRYILNINSRTLFKSSGKKCNFKCDCGHEFNTALAKINSGNWCPYCTNQKLCNKQDCKQCFEKSFASHEKSKYLLKENPRTLFLNSQKKYKFNCNKCKHEFFTSLAKINFERWCPYCAIPSRILCNKQDCKQCFDRSFASHEKSKYLVGENPRMLFLNSHKKHNFKCDCGHEFSARLADINRNGFCPYCGNQKLCDKQDCKQCFNRSFASHEKSKYLVDENPRILFKSSGKEYKFKCDCGHDFIKILDKINKGEFCPYCTNRKLCDNKDCKFCFNHSFASHEKSKYLLNENPRMLFKSSGKKYEFKCDKCDHKFLAILGCINNNCWCPYCAIPSKILCDKQDCKQCHEKSFINHEKAKYLLNENPRMLFRNSGKKCQFNCPFCKQIYESALNNINAGKWCSCTVNKTEFKVFEYLKSRNFTVEREKKFPDLGNRRFDFYFPDYNLVIEIDGAQHFEQVSNWTSPEKTQEIDIEKMKFANSRGITILRFCQEEIFSDTINWKQIIDDHCRLFWPPRILYFSKSIEIYNNHKH